MSEPGPAREFRLGIIGGCLTHQRDIPFGRLYHRKLGQRLRAESNLALRVRISDTFDRSYADRLRLLAEAHPLDAVLLHVRAAAARKIRLWIILGEEGNYRYILHPALWRRSWLGRWADAERTGFPDARVIWRRRLRTAPVPPPAAAPSDGELAQSPATMTTANPAVAPGQRRRHVAPAPVEAGEGTPGGKRRWWRPSLRSLVDAAGVAVGLGRWAIQDELAEVRAARAEAQRLGLPLYVMGPSPDLGSATRQAWLKQLERALASELQALGTPFCALTDLQQSVSAGVTPGFRDDGAHLTEEGHVRVAAALDRAFSASWRMLV